MFAQHLSDQMRRFIDELKKNRQRKQAAAAKGRAIDCMELEDRILLSASPIAPEALVNKAPAEAQQTTPQTAKAVAADASGNHVVVWSSQNPDQSWAVNAQRFNAAGAAQGDKLTVNSQAAGQQQEASVSMNADGNFVVTWTQHNNSTNSNDVYAKRFDDHGNAIGDEFKVNAHTGDDLDSVSVAMNSDDSFVITWSGKNQDGDGWGVFGRQYDSLGNAVSNSEFQINSTTTGDQMSSRVATDTAGNFTVIWQSQETSGGLSSTGIYGQRFDSSGSTQGTEFRVNATTAGDQADPSIAMSTTGKFVVTWSSNAQDGNGQGVYAQRFNADGSVIGGEFLVNTTTAGNQTASAIAIDGSGAFVITWSSYGQDASGTWGVYSQAYSADGTANGPETRVNSTTAGSQNDSSVAFLDSGSYVVVWSGNGDGDSAGVFASVCDTSLLGQYVDLAPINTVSSEQTVNVNSPLIFSSANNNAISIADPGTEDVSSSVVILNSSFETGTTGSGITDGLWHFDAVTKTDNNKTSNSSGLSFNGAWSHVGIPDGDKFANLRGHASISQDITFTEAGTYTLSFQAAYATATPTNPIQVQIDGVAVGVVTPDTGYFKAYSVTFSVTAGTHKLAFVGLCPSIGTRHSFIDRVAINKTEAQVQTTISVTAGTFTLGSTNGLSIVSGAGRDDSSLTVLGTVADINAALEGLRYLPGANYYGSDVLTITTTDHAGHSDTDTVAINVANPTQYSGLRATYYNNTTLSGTGVSRIDSTINYDLSAAGEEVTPVSGVSATGWSAIWEGKVQATTTGTYTFYADVNGTATLTVNGVTVSGTRLVVVNSSTPSVTLAPCCNLTVNLVAGEWYDIRLSYSKASAVTVVAQLSWATPGGTKTIIPSSQLSCEELVHFNVAPVNTVPSAQSITVNQTVVFSTATGNAIQISDANNVNSYANSLVSVTLSVDYGTLTLRNMNAGVAAASLSNVTLSAGTGFNDKTVTIVGTVANINAALNGLTYMPGVDYAGTAHLQITTNDLGTDYINGAKTDTDTVAINVSVPSGSSGLLAAYYDNENLQGTAVYRIDTTTTFDWGNEGSPVSGIAGTTWSASWQGEILADYSEVYTFTITADDGYRLWINDQLLIDNWNGLGTASHTIALTADEWYSIRIDYKQLPVYSNLNLTWSSASQTQGTIPSDHLNCADLIQQVSAMAVNATSANTATTLLNTPFVFSTAHGNAFTVADADAGYTSSINSVLTADVAQLVQVTLTADQGTLTLAGTSGITFLTGDGTNDASITFTGSLANVNAALDGLQYMPALDGVAVGDEAAHVQISAKYALGAVFGTPNVSTSTVAVNVTSPADYTGLLATYYNNRDLTGTGVQRVDARLDFNWGHEESPAPGIVGTTWSANWRGQIQAATTGDYTFYLIGDDGVRLWVGDMSTPVIDEWHNSSGNTYTCTVHLTAGEWYAIRVNYYQNTGDQLLKLEWSSDDVAREVIPSSQLSHENLAPVNTVPGAQTTNEGADLVFSTEKGNVIQVSDQDVSYGLLQVTLTADNGTSDGGTITLADTSGLTFISGANGTDSMTFTGSVANINAALDGLCYKSAVSQSSGYIEAAQLRITTTDIGETLTGEAKSVTSTIDVAITAPWEYDGLLATYYNNSDFTGTTVQRVDTEIDFDWGNETPLVEGIDSTTWSARWLGTIQADYTETYTFYTTANDGVQLWVNGVLLIDHLNNTGTDSYSATIALVAGQTYTFRMDYQQVSGDANAKLEWSSASQAREVISAEHFETADQTPVNAVPSIQYGIGTQAIVFSEASSNAIAVTELHYDQKPLIVTLTASQGTLTLGSTNELEITGGAIGSSTITFTGTLANINAALDGLSYTRQSDYAGAATIQITSVNPSAQGGARSSAKTIQIGAVQASNPGLVATYYSNTWLGTAVTTQIDSQINFDWGAAGSPVSGIASTNYSVRWDGLIAAQETGAHTFYATSDDGCRLWVNGTLLIDNWGPQELATNSATIDLVAGQQYTIRMEYCQFSATSSAKLEWAGPTMERQVVSAGALSHQCQSPINYLPSSASTTEDSSVVFSAANGNAISICDIDAQGGLLRVTVSATDGAITLGSISGLTFSAGDGANDATMTFTGTLDSINVAFEGLVFTPTANYAGGTSICLVTTDLGTEKTTESSMPITVIAVNDAPTNTVPGSISVNEHDVLTFSTANGNAIVIGDVDIDATDEGVALVNGDFELVSIGTKAYGIPSTDAGWTFESTYWTNGGTVPNSSGIASNGSAIGNRDAIDGTQVAYLQGSGAMSQNVTFAESGTYTIGFQAAYRKSTGSHAFTVLLDGVSVETFNPGTYGGKGASATLYNVSAGTHRITFLGASETSDECVFIDHVSIAKTSSLVQVTLSVDNGALSLTNNAGVIFNIGNGTDNTSMRITGSLAAVNATIDGLTFTPASGFSGTANLKIVTNDLGNVGTGGTKSTTTTTTINVVAVNEAPQNTVPVASQSTYGSNTIVFSTACSNAISVGDPDTTDGVMQVTLTVAHGSLTLSSTDGLTFVTGDGLGDASMTFTGTISSINAALNGLSYSATSDYFGSDQFQILTNDLGSIGIGGPLTAESTINITVLSGPIVNSTVDGVQQLSWESPQAVASDASGNYVVVWASENQDGSGWGIYARRFSASGNAQGEEFLVNTVTTGNQLYPTVAMNAAGNFVITWTSKTSATSGSSDVYARCYNADGTARGGQILVNTYTIGDQKYTSVAMDADGDFVVTWSSQGQDGSGWGVYGQRFDSSGNRAGSEFRVGTTTTGDQMYARTAMDSTGNFTVVWQGPDAAGLGVYGRQFNSSGVAVGAEFQVNSDTAGDQYNVNIGMNDSGTFVVTWTSSSANGQSILAKVYNANGSVQNTLTVAAATSSITRDYSSVAVDRLGNFFITWSSLGQDEGDTWSVYGQRYSSGGTAVGTETRINATTDGSQAYSSITALSPDNYMVVWSGSAPGETAGVFYSEQCPVGLLVSYYNNMEANGTVVAEGVATGNFSYHWATDTSPAAGVSTTYWSASYTGLIKADTSEIYTFYLTGDDGIRLYINGQRLVNGWVAQSPTEYSASYNMVAGEWYEITVEYFQKTVSGDLKLEWSSDSVAREVIPCTQFTYYNKAATVSAPTLPSTNEDKDLIFSNGVTFAHGNFESASIAANNYALGGTVDGWSFTAHNTDNGDSGSGIAAAWSAYNNPTAPEGSQVALIQGHATMSREVVFNRDGNVTISLQAAYRDYYNGTNPIAVQIDGVTVATITPTSTSFQRYETEAFWVSAGPHTISFVGTTTGGPDRTTFIDQVDISYVGDARAITISDSDSTSGELLTVSLSVDHGELSLGGFNGLTMLNGDGTGDATMSFRGTASVINAALNGLVFKPEANFNGNATLRITTTDEGGMGGPKTATTNLVVNVVSLNDAPINFTPAQQIIFEDQTLTFSDRNENAISISDLDAGDSVVQVTLSSMHGFVSLSSLDGLTFLEGNGKDDAVITMRGTISSINAALDGLQFTSEANFAGTATLRIITNDLGNTGIGGALTADSLIEIAVAAVNDAPINVAPVTQDAYTQYAKTFSITTGNAIQVTDLDAGNSQEQVTISVDQGKLTLRSINGLTFLYGDGSDDAEITMQGTLANINAALDGLKYKAKDGFEGIAHLTISTNDLGNTGLGGALTDTNIVAINVRRANEAPVNTVPVATQRVFEHQTVTFSSANNNAITVGDPDAGNSAVMVTLTTDHGTLSLSGIRGLTFLSGSGVNGTTMTFTGTLANINAALEGMQFNPADNYDGAAELRITTNDLGNSGAGGAKTDSKTVSIAITAVNDAPVVASPYQLSILEDESVVFSAANGNAVSISDSDVGTGPVQVTLTTNRGTIALGSVKGLTFVNNSSSTGSSIIIRGALADINAALDGMTYTSATTVSDYTATLQITANDFGGSGVGGPMTTVRNISIGVTAVNDAPVVTIPEMQGYDFTNIVFSSAGGNAIRVTDTDAGGNQVLATIMTSEATFTLGSTEGLSILGGTPAQSSFIMIYGTIDSINKALDGLALNASSSYAALQVSVNDLGVNQGAGGPQETKQTFYVRRMIDPNFQPASSTAHFQALTGVLTQPVSISAANTLLTGTQGQLKLAQLEREQINSSLIAAYALQNGNGYRNDAAATDRAAGQLYRNDLERQIEMSEIRDARGTEEGQFTADTQNVNEPVQQVSTLRSEENILVGLGIASAGYLAWAFNGGSLLAGALSATPMWMPFDPLAVLDFSDRAAKAGMLPLDSDAGLAGEENLQSLLS